MKAQCGDYIKYNRDDGSQHISQVVQVDEYDIGTDYTEWEYTMANGDYVLNSDIHRDDVYLESEMDEA